MLGFISNIRISQCIETGAVCLLEENCCDENTLSSNIEDKISCCEALKFSNQEILWLDDPSIKIKNIYNVESALVSFDFASNNIVLNKTSGTSPPVNCNFEPRRPSSNPLFLTNCTILC